MSVVGLTGKFAGGFSLSPLWEPPIIRIDSCPKASKNDVRPAVYPTVRISHLTLPRRQVLRFLHTYERRHNNGRPQLFHPKETHTVSGLHDQRAPTPQEGDKSGRPDHQPQNHYNNEIYLNQQT